MSAPVVGGDLFRWELAISDLTPDKTGKTGGDVPEILFESRQLQAVAGGGDYAYLYFLCKNRRWAGFAAALEKRPEAII